MKLLLTRYTTTVLIIITVPLPLFLSCRLLVTPLVPFTVSLCAFYFCKDHRKPTVFFSASRVEHVQHKQDQFRCRHGAFLYIDDVPIASRAHSPIPLLKRLASYSLPSANILLRFIIM